ncbi:hypothetical protein GCM10023222_36470 [Saccharopolyspora cebuensis]
MSSRKRISVALVGLIALVVIGWFVRDYAGSGTSEHSAPGAVEFRLPVRNLAELPPEADRASAPPGRSPLPPGDSRPGSSSHDRAVPVPGPAAAGSAAVGHREQVRALPQQRS